MQGSLSQRGFLGLVFDQRVPRRSSMTVIRKRRPLEVSEQVFASVLKLMIEGGAVKGYHVAVDSTMLEDKRGDDVDRLRRYASPHWAEYIKRLTREDGAATRSQSTRTCAVSTGREQNLEQGREVAFRP